MKINHYPRFLYINPIEGKIISYDSINKFPHEPNYMLNLNEITRCEHMTKRKWWFRKG